MSSHLGVGFGEQYLILRCFYCWTLGTFGPDDPCFFEYFVLADSVSVDVFLDSGCSACSVCRVWEIFALGSKWSLGLFNLYIFLFYRNFLFLTRFV